MNLIQKCQSYLFGYTLLGKLAPGESYSSNLKVKRNFGGGLWAGKISRPLPARMENFRDTGRPYIRTVDFRDLDARAMLGFRLAKVAGLRSLKAKIIPIRRIEGLDVAHIEHERLDDTIFLTEFSGQSLANYLQSNGFTSIEASDIKNKDEVIKSFVFNVWIGNYDNKDRDYLVDEDKNLISIDYHMFGPGFRDDPGLALGSWGEAFDMSEPADTGWCIGDGTLLQYLKTHSGDWQPFERAIKSIRSISTLQITFAMRGLRFYKQGTKEEINGLFSDFLLQRKGKLEETIRAWIKADYPLAQLPKENGIV